eukprot:262502_1
MLNLFPLFFSFTQFIFLNSATESPTCTGVSSFIFLNSDTVSRNESFELVEISAIYGEGYQYKNDPLSSNIWAPGVTKNLQYLFGINKTNNSTNKYYIPSSGMRSAPALGAFGQGTFEIRADGRQTDFTIFNNAPNMEPSTFARKWDLNEAVFGFLIENDISSARILQTQPLDEDYMNKYAIESLEYSGSYPVARLIARDSYWFNNYNIISITFTSFSSFEPFNINMSSIPAVIFWFDIQTVNNESLVIDFFYNWPDMLNMEVMELGNNGFRMKKTQNDGLINDTNYANQTFGDMTFKTYLCDSISNQCNNKQQGYMTVSNTLNENWNLFIGESNAYVDKKFSYSTKGSILPLIYQNIGWIARNISLQSSKTSLSLIFSWYFPNRAWNGNKEFLGHFYTNLYNSSLDVNDQIQSTLLPNIINNVCKWHLLWANSLSLPELYPKTLLDTFLNGPQAYSRTGFHLKTSDWSNSGHWRQFEGFSCNQVEPPSMMGYRNFGLQLLFGKELNRNGILNMYNKGLNQTNNGIIGELYGGQCFGIGNT